MGSAPQIASEIHDFYTDAYDEAARLTSSADGVLERVRTQEILRRHLPAAPASVLDVGGGPGAHAQWLMEDGYRVRLVDPVMRHVEQAAALGIGAEAGDARALPAETASCDVVLLLGPLYHLLERAERDQALAEARRVVRPGGLVAAAAIGRYASLYEHVATTLLGGETVRDAVADILRTGRHEPGRKGFTAAYFHTAEGLAEELTAAGFGQVAVHGIEGPAWACLKAAERHTGESLIGSPMFAAALTSARLAEPYPALLASSSHLLATARA
ncbi:class I SAM-dependent methyltransferase [Streptomyces jumonjinensis]|uniref:Class I SAM-dependent methyltransferase n=1 Tax=Streptomyces jumonjinensis TaxID=1945 RepID=A0A646KGB4_STRJU|nr:class I SAM-dependent methyltransferase [Streptomyces jumonjinensis]MQT01319.1 class I SAM-dependent methyltransferase [Streptomyces jumonjinensis]